MTPCASALERLLARNGPLSDVLIPQGNKAIRKSGPADNRVRRPVTDRRLNDRGEIENPDEGCGQRGGGAHASVITRTKFMTPPQWPRRLGSGGAEYHEESNAYWANESAIRMGM